MPELVSRYVNKHFVMCLFVLENCQLHICYFLLHSAIVDIRFNVQSSFSSARCQKITIFSRNFILEVLRCKISLANISQDKIHEKDSQTVGTNCSKIPTSHLDILVESILMKEETCTLSLKKEQLFT